MTIYLTCRNCSWVHFEVSYQRAYSEIRRFNKYYASLEPILRDYYNGPSSISDYSYCGRCGVNYNHFRRAKKKEIPFGSTVNPILRRKKK